MLIMPQGNCGNSLMQRLKQIVFLSSCVVLPSVITYAQNIHVVTGDTVISGSIGSEMVLCVHVINSSSVSQTVFLVRTENRIPEGWTSSLCLGGNCFAPYIDSALSSELLHSHDTLEASVHFVSSAIIPGTAQVQIQIGTMYNPDVRTTVSLTASTRSTAMSEQLVALGVCPSKLLGGIG